VHFVLASKLKLKLLAGLLLALFCVTAHAEKTEPYNTGWEFYFDNDAFALPNVYSDQDYTGGMALSLLGRRAAEYPISLDPVRHSIDRLFGHESLYADPNATMQHSIEFGFTAFTPKDLSTSAPIYNDRPYSSMVFLANSLKVTVPEKYIAFHSTFILGALGLRVSEQVQTTIHHILGINPANGWHNQISDGGELTARYVFSRQRLRAYRPTSARMGYQVNTMFSGSVGYITDVGVGLFARGGKIRSPWWGFNPQQSEFIPIGAPIISSDAVLGGTESYIWAGMNLRYRFYDALLQGQFRYSPVTYSEDQIQHVILEGWVGYTRSLGEHYRVNFTIRSSTPELNIGQERAPVWASIIISKSL